MNPGEAGVPQISLWALFLKFLRFGCLAFGGPVAQIAMVRHALVEEERWISPARFNRLLAVMQALPGPEAHELCVHMGMMARGRIGGLLAGLAFMLPGFLLMLGSAWFYRDWIAGSAAMARAFLGVQIVVMAVLLRAVHRIGGHALGDGVLVLLAAGAFIATVVGAPFWIPLAGAGLIYAFAARPIVAAVIAMTCAGLAALFLLSAGAGGSGMSTQGAGASVLLLFAAGLKGGLLTFGGAYTAIPYVRADTVGRGWLPDSSFLDGVALAGVLPAPLVVFATFAGYLAGGLWGAAAITAGMFLPAFAFSMVFFERLEAIVENPALHRVLAGVAAAVVGVIAATVLVLARAVAGSVGNGAVALGLFLAGSAAVWLLKGPWVTPALVVAAGCAGWLLHP